MKIWNIPDSEMIRYLHQIQDIHNAITIDVRIRTGFPNRQRNPHQIQDVNLAIRVEIGLRFIKDFKTDNLCEIKQLTLPDFVSQYVVGKLQLIFQLS